MIHMYQKDSVWSTKEKHKKILQGFSLLHFPTLKFNSTFMTCSRSKSNGGDSDPDNTLSSGQDSALISYLILEAFDRNGQKWMKTFTSVAKVKKKK